MRRLGREYYLSEDVISLSNSLLGKELCTMFDGNLTKGMIVETEAYRAPEDQGSHAFGNKRTARTETIFGIGGTAYVYLIYGIHHLFNVVVAQENVAHAVLIRALEPTDGISHMQQRRGVGKEIDLCNGPGKLSQALGISTQHDKFDLTKKNSQIWIQDSMTFTKDQIISSPRVGIGYAGESKYWPWRFRVKNHPNTSKPHHVNYP